ncbi:hypothetical protein SAMD00019534_125650 [Acytostelium subglobosum LB1]|uniref:hypothetical protein n=1 Tax=Acytostelium subglobosum LB1 TaxID=1410327 RepID=UPI000644E0C9|nr:hypothetical protein SAMD00019534_125650 [Acytostelium subglobosum LB1]GAM29389.1 hypothetical protein SAMD00019534_125650 [Acytostelium subglobosum LB1]|eukprot:XP_012747657.1 hypothetical protein SAMD00019534_125650 [Acytostelium subglobosum LB1]
MSVADDSSSSNGGITLPMSSPTSQTTSPIAYDKYVNPMSCALSLMMAAFAIGMIVYSVVNNQPYTTWLSLLAGVWGIWMPTPVLRFRQQQQQQQEHKVTEQSQRFYQTDPVVDANERQQ